MRKTLFFFSVVEHLSEFDESHNVALNFFKNKNILLISIELLRVDSQQVSTSTRRSSCQLSDENGNGLVDDEDDDILETTIWETSPKRMKRWVDINEN